MNTLLNVILLLRSGSIYRRNIKFIIILLFIISLRIYSRKGFGENNILKLLTNPCNENPLSISNILFGTLTIERIENSIEPNYMIGIRLGSVKELEGNA